MNKIKTMLNKYVGEIVRIIFLDHTQNSFEPMVCELIGKVWSVNKSHVVIVTWDIYDENEDTRKNNMEMFSILLTSIQKAFVYKKYKKIL